MTVIGRYKRNACLIRYLNKGGIYLCLFGRRICLDLKIVIASAEEPVIPYRSLCSLLSLTRRTYTPAEVQLIYAELGEP